MNLVSYADRLEIRIEAAFDAAVDDTMFEAQDIAERHSRTGKFADSITRTELVVSEGKLEARIGSPLASAKAKEKGAYIVPVKAPKLVFDAGQGIRKVDSVRLAPQPAVTPAGRRFAEFMTKRLRERHS